jgi:uncharacterized membrane protein YphA (DoxX/SURF4 family)
VRSKAAPLQPPASSYLLLELLELFFCAFLRLFVFSVNPQNHKSLAYGTFRFGLGLILGVFTRWTLVAASLLMSILIFGTSLRSDWATVSIQMIYVIAFFIALFFLEHNRYSVDRIIRREEA